MDELTSMDELQTFEDLVNDVFFMYFLENSCSLSNERGGKCITITACKSVSMKSKTM